MLPLWIWDCLMWSTTLGETNCNRCFNIHQIGTTPSSYPYHTRHNRQKHCWHLEEDGDCIGFPLIGNGSLLIGRQGSCSSQWPWWSWFQYSTIEILKAGEINSSPSCSFEDSWFHGSPATSSRKLASWNNKVRSKMFMHVKRQCLKQCML